MPGTGPTPYWLSLSPLQQQQRLALMRQYNPNATDDMIRFMDTGDLNGPGAYQNWLNRPPTAYELAVKAESDRQNNASNWTDALRPATIAGAGMVASGGRSLFGYMGGSPSGPNVPSASQQYQPYGSSNAGLLSLLSNLGMGGIGGTQGQSPGPPPSLPDPFAGQNAFTQNPLSPDQIYGGIAPIPINLQTELKRLSR